MASLEATSRAASTIGPGTREWSAKELFGDDPLLERVVGVEQQLHGGRGVLPDGDRYDVEQLMEVGGGGKSRLSASRFSTTTSAVWGTRAPFHRRRRNGLTGVTASRWSRAG